MAARACRDVLFWCVGMLVAGPLGAQVPEPETVFYGRIINRTSGQEYQLRDGVISWSVSGGGGAPIDLSAPLGSIQDGKYSYVLKVPHQAKSLDLKVDAGALPLKSVDTEFDTTNILVNGQPAAPIGGSRQFIASQPKRGGIYRLDLEVFDPLDDTDGDGIPDWWEDLYGLDKQWAGDAKLRTGDNRYTNLEAFRLGLDPRRDDRAPQLLTTELSVMSEGETGLLLRATASTTAPSQIAYQLTALPAGGTVVLCNARPDPKMPNRILKAGETFTQADVDAGLIKFEHVDPAIRLTSLNLLVTALNRPDQSVSGEVTLDVYRPEPVDGRAGVQLAASATSAAPAGGTAFDLWKKRATSAFAEEWAGAEGQKDEIAAFLLARWFGFTVWDGREELPSRNLKVPSAGLSINDYAAYQRRYGRPGGHVLFAGAGTVRIDGGMSGDVLIAGKGSTTLRGNLGADLFVVGPDQAIIEDFKSGEGDVLDLSDLLHGVSGALGERVQVAASGNDTRLRIPLDGDKAAVIILRGIKSVNVNLEKWRRGRTIFTGDLTNVAVPENQAPEAVPDEGYVVAGEPVTVAVLANDLDPDGDALTIESVTLGSAGSTAIVGDNIVYTPGPGFAGHDQFNYTVSDGHDGIAIGLVTISYPYPAAAGTYLPLVLSASGEPVGGMTVGLLSSGAVTVRLRLRGVSYSGRGEFDADGFAEIVLTTGASSVTVRLNIDLTDPNYPLTGEIVTPDGVDSLMQSVAATTPKTRLPQDLCFTVALHMPAGEGVAHGFATVKLPRAGVARIAGQVADGSPFSASVAQSRDGTVTWTVPLYKRTGWLLANWNLLESPGAPLGGSTRWVRNAAVGGFDRLLPTEASRYVAPSVATVSVFDFSDPANVADVALREGGLAAPLDFAVTFLKADTIQKEAGSPLALKVTRASGLFTGTLSIEKSARPIRGAILQDKNQGYGFFLNGAESGSVEMLPR